MDENFNNDNPFTYKKVSDFQSKKQSLGFMKGVALPFISGILGTTIVIGTCFGVPVIRDKILPNYASSAPASNNSQTSLNNLTSVSLTNYSETAVYVANKVLPSIVGIEVEYPVNSIFNNSNATASGSGIIISEDGYILTNNHIVNSSGSSSYYQVTEASKLKVKLYNDTNTYEAKIVGTDPHTDLAVIKIDKTGLTAAELGNSDNTKVGEFAMAVGNPLGLDSSVTCGIISAVNRNVTDSEGKQYNLIQTDAAINSGNSGGALVNSEGKVIGINTLKLSGSGIEGMGFAIPINSTIDIYNQLIQYSKVKRPYIGISGIDLDEKTAQYNNLVVGIYVKSVADFSAAQKANIKNGDVIIEADGKKVTSMDELNTIKNSHKIGDTISMKLLRDGKEITIDLTLGEE